MKVNPILAIIALLLAALLSYALYMYCRTPELQWLITIAGGVSLFLSWGGTLAVSVPERRSNVNFKVLSGIFAVIVTVLQFVFTLSHPSQTTYILWTGILLLIWLLMAYVIGRKTEE